MFLSLWQISGKYVANEWQICGTSYAFCGKCCGKQNTIVAQCGKRNANYLPQLCIIISVICVVCGTSGKRFGIFFFLR